MSGGFIKRLHNHLFISIYIATTCIVIVGLHHTHASSDKIGDDFPPVALL